MPASVYITWMDIRNKENKFKLPGMKIKFLVIVLVFTFAACRQTENNNNHETSSGSDSGSITNIPKPDPAFNGIIAPTTEGAKPDFPKPVKAPAGAPNVL